MLTYLHSGIRNGSLFIPIVLKALVIKNDSALKNLGISGGHEWVKEWMITVYSSII